MREETSAADLDRAHVWHPFTRTDQWLAEEPLVIDRADGCWLIDADGNRYLDGNSSLWVNLHGHRRRELDDALRAQLDKVAHATFLGLSNAPAAELAARLVELAPRGLEWVFFSESGASAVEVALKMAFAYWRHQGDEERTLFVSMDGAYHGDTIGSVSVGHIDAFHSAFGPLLFPTRSFAQPYCYRCPLGLTYPSCELACADTLEDVLAAEGDRVAAVVVEPLVQGAAGIITAPDGHLARVAEIARRHGALLIVDEVATGFGRTGALFASQLEGVSPDLMAVGKGLTGGYLPMSATLATAEIFDSFRGPGRTFFHGHSYSGNPLSAAVALASLKLLVDEGGLERAQALAESLSRELKRFEGVAHVGDIRQRGLMAGVELVADVASKAPFPPEWQVGAQVCRRARDLGLVIRPLGDTIVVMPATTMTAEELRFLCDTLVQAIDAVTASLASPAGAPGTGLPDAGAPATRAPGVGDA
ncbi:MAG TPA: adenosylmethionine--8-amino-7-oxononanoate transaminase [Egibacteraceae bacterium]|nr:adenosylmethionine--8-amino-7-oxononanoate transaminase [Egibacteraceae bacterium]